MPRGRGQRRRQRNQAAKCRSIKSGPMAERSPKQALGHLENAPSDTRAEEPPPAPWPGSLHMLSEFHQQQDPERKLVCTACLSSFRPAPHPPPAPGTCPLPPSQTIFSTGLRPPRSESLTLGSHFHEAGPCSPLQYD